MTTLYLIRHCETEANRTHLFQGSHDYELSETGIKQLACLEKRFENMHIDAVFSSPQPRAMKTARAVRGKRDMGITEVPEIRELNAGVHESTRFGLYLKTDPVMYDIWYNKPHLFEPENGERARDVYARTRAGIQRIVEQSRDKTVAVTTHGFALRCILTYLEFDDITRLAEVEIPFNTAVTTVEFYDDGSHKIVSVGDTSHLPDELKTFFVAK